MLDPLVVGSLLVWGTIVGVDLVSFPQAMLNRPLVAASVTGFLIGDLEAGLRIGLLLECFALDVIPIGATRYPDFGPASVVATAVVPVIIGALCLRGALPVGSRWIAAALGAGGGCLGGLVLHLHCHIADSLHIGLIHGGVVVVAALLAGALAPRATDRPLT